MLFAACANTRPTIARAKKSQFACTGFGPATARRPPIAPEVRVMGKTLARVISSHFETRSMRRPWERFWVVSTSRQFSSTVAMETSEGKLLGGGLGQEAATLLGRWHRALRTLAEPAIAVCSDPVVDGVAQSAWNDAKQGENRPKPREPGDDTEHRITLHERVLPFHQHDARARVCGEPHPCEQLASLRGLKRRKSKTLARVSGEHEAHAAVAEVANPVKENGRPLYHYSSK